jgi:hypothetical protein
MAYDIVVFGMNKFRDFQDERSKNRSFYVLQELLKRNDVNKILYIDYLPVKRKAALIDYFSFLPRLTKHTVHLTTLSVCNELKPGKFYNYASVASVVNWKAVYRDIKDVLKKLNFNNIIIWSYDPLNVDFFDELENEISVFDVDSDWRNNQNLPQDEKIDFIDVLRKNYNRMANHADFIFTASDELLEVFMGHDQSYWINDLNQQELDKIDWKAIVDEMFSYINKKPI